MASIEEIDRQLKEHQEALVISTNAAHSEWLKVVIDSLLDDRLKEELATTNA